MSVRNQCKLLSLSRSSYYYSAVEEKAEDLLFKRLIDEEYTRHPFLGSRRMTIYLRSLQHEVNRKRVQRLMQEMGLEAIYPKKNLSKADKHHKKYPYLLRDFKITQPNQVWSTDITYIRLMSGFAYCTAILDWYSRYVIAWRLSNTLESSFCIEALEEALKSGIPMIFNTDQGVQYTSMLFTSILEQLSIQISMDGKGRALDNVFVERLWRSLKYEEVYIKDYKNVQEARKSIGAYFDYYNNQRPHQSLNYQCPYKVHFGQ